MATKNSAAPTGGPQGETLKTLRKVAGHIATSPAPGVKTSGVKIRGTGAATKGTMARGPMA